MDATFPDVPVEVLKIHPLFAEASTVKYVAQSPVTGPYVPNVLVPANIIP